MKLRVITQRLSLQAILISILWLIPLPVAEAGNSFVFLQEKAGNYVMGNPSISFDDQVVAGEKTEKVIAQTEALSYSIFLPIIFSPQSYYISLKGVDPSNCRGGTKAEPWKTWTKAEKCIAPGTTVYFMAGSYSTIFSEPRRAAITFNGEPGKPILIKPESGAEGQVRFNQPFSIYGKYGHLSGINISSSNPAVPLISIYQATHIQLQDNKIHHSPVRDCIHIHRDSDSISLVNNEIYACGYDNNDNGQGDAIDTTGGTNLVYRGNNIHDSFNGIQVKGGAMNILIENNRIHDVGTAIFGSSMGSLPGSQPQHGNLAMHDPSVPISDRYQAENLIIRNNLIYNIQFFSALSPRGWVDYRIYNNTFFNHFGSYVFYLNHAGWEFFDSSAIAYCASHSCSPCTEYSGELTCVNVALPNKNGKIKNNIFYGFNKVLSAEPGNSSSLEITNNLYQTQGFGPTTTKAYRIKNISYSFFGFQALGYEMDSLIANPRFTDTTDPGNPNFKLISTSPAIDHGQSLEEVPNDYDGTARPQGTIHDIGAYEFWWETTAVATTTIGSPMLTP